MAQNLRMSTPASRRGIAALRRNRRGLSGEMAESVELRFLQTEVRTGLTTANIARNSKQRNRRERNLALARKAYVTALRFAAKTYLPDNIAADLRNDLETLKKQLEDLGEEF